MNEIVTKLLASTAALALTAYSLGAAAQSPQAPSVAAGSIAVTRQGATTVVTQSTAKGIIDWRSFSIGPQEAVRFDQPGRSSVTLNRVTGAEASRIDGNLSATGQVWLANPNGVLIGSGSQVNVGGLLATTGRVDASEFLRSGRAQIDQIGKDAAIVNQGSINLAEGGYAALAAASIRNEGVIAARTGSVALGAGKAMTVDFNGDKLIQFQVTQPLDQAPKNADAAIVNSGTIAAQGGTVLMTARAAKGVMDNVVNLKGHVISNAVRIDGGTVMFGDGGAVQVSAKIDASNATGDGGTIAVSGPIATLEVESKLLAGGTGRGGRIDLQADVLNSGGLAEASGDSGGAITASARTVLHSGSFIADGTTGRGGEVIVKATQNYAATQGSRLQADSRTGDGGAVRFIGTNTGSADGVATARLFTSGAQTARSGTARGGTVDLIGRDIILMAATADVSGGSAGGTIRVGGDWQGSGTLAHAKTLFSSGYTTFKASATLGGDGGKVVAWSDDKTSFFSTVEAKRGPLGGSGGQVEVSSKNQLVFGGKVTAASLLLDPKDIVIDSSGGGSFSQNTLADPGSGGSSFGQSIVYVNGNIAVTSPGDSSVASNNGASYLFDGSTYALISTLKGSSAGDLVSNGGILLLGATGNYIIRSSSWNGGAGAVTFASGATGVGTNVTLSSANSLVGTLSTDQVGAGSAIDPTTGNYAVISPNWTNSGTSAAGAVTFASGTSGITGVVGVGNSLVGTTINDQVGSGGVTVLTNGKFVVSSPFWNGGAGAVTLFSVGMSGTVVTSGNSLIGSTPFDGVGSNPIVKLTNGNFIVSSPNWRNGGIVGAGAVTWVDGTVGMTGPVSTSNSLYGTATNDSVGTSTALALPNGNYVVRSPSWNGTRGAATWGDGTLGITGPVSNGNSLVGSTVGDFVGTDVFGLVGNGNYVVVSPNWNYLGSYPNAGAATWSDGSVVGPVTGSNSIIGTNNGDKVGFGGVTALNNGNYVIKSYKWNGERGAATWGIGTQTSSGAVSITNSLVGTTASDFVGQEVVSLGANGNYVVTAPGWTNGGTGGAGAVTWGDGATGTVGAVTTLNSIYGTYTNDFVGSGGVTVLNNGNYIIQSPSWTNGGAFVYAGAATWASGGSATSAAVSSTNSLVGGATNDKVGLSVRALSNGNYVVASPSWTNGPATFAGAVTFGIGTTGVTGSVSGANSIIGSTANDFVGSGSIFEGPGGNYFISSQSWTNSGISAAGAITRGDGISGTSGTISASNSVLGQTTNELLILYLASSSTLVGRGPTGVIRYGSFGAGPAVSSTFFGTSPSASVTMSGADLASTLAAGTAITLQANNDISVNAAINVTGSTGGALTLQAGRSILINAPITTANGNLTLIANERTANGVVDANRDLGDAVITAAQAANINAGTGNLVIKINDGAGVTNSTNGDISISSAITANSLNIQNLGPTTGGYKVSLTGDISITGTGTSSILAQNGSVRLGSGGPTSTYTYSGASAGSLSIAAGGGVLLDSQIITSTSGALSITLNTAVNAVSQAAVDGAVVLQSSSTISTAGGSLSMVAGSGAGLAPQGGALLSNSGVALLSSEIDTGAGQILIRGFGRQGDTNPGNDGVVVQTTSIASSGGITITGTSGDASLSNAVGVRVNGGTITATGSGSLSITGTSIAPGAQAHGVLLMSNALLTTVDGAITVSGNGATAGTSADHGVLVDGSKITATGTGSISLVGVRGGGSGSLNVNLTNGTLSTVSGNLTLNGTATTGGASSTNYGVGLSSNALVTTASGAISISGNGASSAGPGGDRGVYIESSVVSATGSGSVSVTGVRGGSPTSANIFLQDGTISTTSGNMTLDGSNTASSGASGDFGIYLNGASALSTTSGTIALNGAGGATGATTGIAISGSTALASITATSGGTISLTGVGGAGGNGVGIYSATLSATNGSLTITTDSLAVGTPTIAASSGTITLRPTASTVSIGVNGAAGTLQISSAVLNSITSGALTIGRSDLTAPITVGTGVLKTNTTLRTGGGDVVFTGAINATSNGGQSLTINAPGGTVTLNGGIGVGTSLSAVNIQAALITNQSGSNTVRSTGTQSYAGPVVLAGNTTMSTSAANVFFSGTVNAATGAETLDLDIGAGTVTFAGAVGGNTALGSIAAILGGATAVLGGGGVKTTGLQSFNKLILTAGATLSTANSQVGVFGLIDGAFALNIDTGVGVGPLQLGSIGSMTPLASLGIVNNATITGNVLTEGSQSYGGSVQVSTANVLFSTGASNASISMGYLYGTGTPNVTVATGTGSLVVAGGVSVGGVNPLNTLTAGNARFGANVFTNGTQSYSGSVVVSGSSVQFTSGGLTMTGPLNGASPNTTAVTFTGTPVTLSGGAGGTTPLASLNLGAATIGGVIATSGTQSYSGALTLAANTSFSAAGSAITFGGDVNGGYDFRVTAAQINLGAGGAIQINTTGATQNYVGAVTLLNDATITAALASFNGTVDASTPGGQFLTTNGGTVSFGAAVGGAAALSSLYSASSVARLSAPITTEGSLSFGGNVLIAGPVDLLSNTSNIAFGGAIDSTSAGSNYLSLGVPNGSPVFSSAIGGGTALNVLYITTGGGAVDLPAVTANNLEVATSGGTVSQTGVLVIAANTTIVSGAGAITLTAGLNNFNQVALNTTSDASITDGIGGLAITNSNVAGNLSVTGSSGGTVTQTGPIEAGTLSLTSTGGSFLLDTNSGNQVGTLTGSGGTIRFANGPSGGLLATDITAGTLVVTQAGGHFLDIAGTTTVSALTASTTGNLLTHGTLTAGSASLTAATTIDDFGDTFITNAPLTISANGGNIDPTIGTVSGVAVASPAFINVVSGSITVYGTVLVPTVATVAPSASTPSVASVPTVAPIAPTIATIATVATVASIPSIATQVNLPIVAAIEPTVAFIASQASVGSTPSPASVSFPLQVIAPDPATANSILSQILQPPVNFSIGGQSLPIGPVGGNQTPSSQNSPTVTSQSQRDLVNGTPPGALIPITGTSVGSTGAPLASAPTVAIAGQDSAGGNPSQAISAIPVPQVETYAGGLVTVAPSQPGSQGSQGSQGSTAPANAANAGAGTRQYPTQPGTTPAVNDATSFVMSVNDEAFY